MINRTVMTTILVILSTLNSFSFDNSISVKFGPYWPDELKNSRKPTAFDFSIQGGKDIDKTLAFGTIFDIIWNVNREEHQILNNLYEEEFIERTVMLPLSIYLSISPISMLPVSPSITGQIGIAFMHYQEKDTVMIGPIPTPYNENGWYFGPVYKIGLDALINLAPKASLFLGADYLWAKPRKIKRSDPHLFTKRDMSGFGLRFGVTAFFNR